MPPISDTLHVVRYTGPFGFIKPWTAVRDSATYSQTFLTPSILEGMRRKMETEPVLRHRLTFAGMSEQMEEVQPRAFGKMEKRPVRKRNVIGRPDDYAEGGVLTRYVLIEPHLYLAFGGLDDARAAARQHLCLCRNEDLVLPDDAVWTVPVAEFDRLPGFEFTAGSRAESDLFAGYNRYAPPEDAAMWGRLSVTGDAVREERFEGAFTTASVGVRRPDSPPQRHARARS